jgi:hypothetical protein
MQGPYERAVTGADVRACARSAGFEDHVLARLGDLVAARDAVADLDDLALRAGPLELGVSRSRWVAAFGPIFGEFE